MNKCVEYKVIINRCNCHPETCCCDDWIVVDSKGEEQCSFFSFKRAEAFAAKLNNMYSYKSNGNTLEEIENE